MKTIFFALSLLALGMPAFAGMDMSSVAGRWRYFMKVYNGQEIPEPIGASLRLYYELSPEGESRLYWWHEGQGDYCERRGRYFLREQKIVDQVQWVNPRNTMGCSSDPDMQLGRVTHTPYSFRGPNLQLKIAFGNDELFYVWEKMPARDSLSGARDISTPEHLR